MSERKTMRPLKGDLWVSIQRGEGRFTVLIEREKVTDAQREAFSEIAHFITQMLFAPSRASTPETPGGET